MVIFYSYVSLPEGNIYIYIYVYIVGIYCDILCDILSGIYSDILLGIVSGIYSDILSGIYSAILSDILFWHLRSGARGSAPAVPEKDKHEEKATLIKSI